jgi:outer membrane protein assembly factor BamB
VVLWRQRAPIEKLERVNRINGPSTPTPCADGKRVYVYFGSFGLIAYDFDGKEAWRKALPIGAVRHGTATSPVLAAGKLIVNGDQEDMKSFLIAVDPADGRTLWQVPRPRCFSSHTTPIRRRAADGADELLLAGSVRLVAYDLKDGAERWSVRGLEAISICPSPVLSEDGTTVFASSLSMGEDHLPTFDALLKKLDKDGDGKISRQEADKLTRDVMDILDTNHDGVLTREEWDAYYDIFKQADAGLFAVRLPGGERGDLSETNVVWKQKKGVADIGSPLCYRGRVFVMQNGGFASCYEAASGKEIYRSKRVGGGSQYFASPVAADGRIYVASTGGVVTVIDAGADEPRVVASDDLGEGIAATPAVVGNVMYVRTSGHVWAFGE